MPDIVTRCRIVLVPVRPAEGKLAAVQQQPTVEDLNRAETDSQAEHLKHLTLAGSRMLQGEQQRVEPRRLRTPGLDGLEARVSARQRGALCAGARRGHKRQDRGLFGAAAEELAANHRGRCAGDTRVGKRDLSIHLQLPVSTGAHGDITDVGGRSGKKVDIARDARKPPHVLVLQVGARGPTADLHGQHVPLALASQVRCEPELHRQLAVRAEAELLPVEPDAAGRAHRTDVQVDLHARLLPGHRRRQVHAVGTRGVVVLVIPAVADVRRIRRVDVINVGVNRKTVAVELPVPGHGHLAPFGVVETRLLEVFDCL
mmetsp:Transcript_97153/g.274799  ORF Transcript_97153/g.274799 Transcript_97153/m.274799 type:complete len:315 (-) Transcript_97153:269-1213(-)